MIFANSPIFRISAAAALFLLSCDSVLSQKADKPVEKQSEKKGLPEDVLKELQSYGDFWAKSVSPLRKKFEEKNFENRIKQIAEAVELDEAKSTLLASAMDDAIEKSHPAWLEAASEYMIETYKKRGTSTVTVDYLKGRRSYMERLSEAGKTSLAASVRIPDGKRAVDAEVWKTALKEALSEEQLKKWNDKLRLLAKEQEKQFEDAIDRFKEQQSKGVKSQLERPVGVVKKTFQFDEKRLADFDKLVADTVANRLDEIGKKYRVAVEKLSDSRREQVFANRLKITVEQDDPAESDAWAEGLEKFLNGNENETWAKEWANFQKKEEGEIKKLTKEVLIARAASVRMQQRNTSQRTVQSILDIIVLDDAEKKKLDELHEKALDAFEKDWMKAAREFLANQSATQRKQNIERGQVYVAPKTESLPTNQKIWIDGLKVILSKEEVTLLEVTVKQREDRRKKSFGNLILLYFDKIIGLNEKQREELVPALAEIGHKRYLKNYQGRAFSTSTLTVHNILRSSTEQKELEKYLSEEQRKRWKSWVDAYSKRYQRKEFKRSPDKPEPTSDKGFVNEAVAAFLHQSVAQRREDFLNYQLGQLEALDRLVKLNQDQKDYLKIAAKGTCEKHLDSAVVEFGEYIQRSMLTVNREQVYQRLSQLGASRLGSEDPEQDGIWSASVDKVLAAEQRTLFEESQTRQSEFKRKVITLQILSHTEFAINLSAEQVDKLKPMVSKLVEKYEPETARAFTSSTPWYFNSTYSLTLIAGIPKKQLKEILSKEQYDRWEKTHFRRIESYWKRIEGYYKERVGEPKLEEEKDAEPKEEEQD